VDEPGLTQTELVVPPDLDGQRADKVLAGLLDISRASSRLLIDGGAVVQGERTVEPSQKLAAGSVLLVTRPAAPAGLQPLNQPLVVRYESAAVLVVDKPPGLVVHPGAGHRNDTLASVLLFHYPELEALAEGHRWGLVHRLDRDTSGLLLVGRTASAHEHLQAQLKARAIRRVYLALVQGLMEPATGTIDAPIGRDVEHPTRMALRQDGRFARTHYRRLAGWDDLSLLEVTLETGRTHQIRVHLSSIGFPLAGDKTYGRRRSDIGNPGRVWLHACRLTFRDPENGEPEVTVDSPLPADLASSLASIGAPLLGEVPPDVLSVDTA
jgi:23S rRNA pseudouridine1911/1915/1917 synthase